MNPTPIPFTPGSLLRLPNFPSRHVAPRHVDVWLPPSYDPATPLPVLYMHDGQNLFLHGYSYAGEPWSMEQAALRLLHAEKIPGVIIVGVWNDGDNRWAEYLPQKATQDPAWHAFAAAHPNLPPTQNLLADAYLRFLVQELKPYIDSHYATLPGRAHTLVMGSSMGGLISLYALTEYPQVFGGAGCVSTHWPAGEDVLLHYFAQHLPAPGEHRLYFDFGTETLDAAYEPLQNKMDALLRAAGYTDQNWLTRKFPGAAHSEPSWRERAHIPLAFLLGVQP